LAIIKNNILNKKLNIYYPHQSADSKNYADLRLQVDASADRTSLRRPSA